MKKQYIGINSRSWMEINIINQKILLFQGLVIRFIGPIDTKKAKLFSEELNNYVSLEDRL